MENNEKVAIDTSKKITVGIVSSWVVGILFLIISIGVLANSVLGGLAVMVGGLILIPTVNDIFIKKFNLNLSGGIRTTIAVVLFSIGVSTMPSTGKESTVGTTIVQAPVAEIVSTNTQPETKVVTPPVVQNTKTTATLTPVKTAAPKTITPVVTPAPVPTPQPASTPAPSTARADTLAKLKANASAKWGTDYQMVKYEYDNQVEAYDWVMSQTAHPDIMAEAKQKWGLDYQMVQYEYKNQVEAYNAL